MPHRPTPYSYSADNKHFRNGRVRFRFEIVFTFLRSNGDHLLLLLTSAFSGEHASYAIIRISRCFDRYFFFLDFFSRTLFDEQHGSHTSSSYTQKGVSTKCYFFKRGDLNCVCEKLVVVVIGFQQLQNLSRTRFIISNF